MSENVNISYNLQRYLQNPTSREARAFFDGARSMMTALQLTPTSDYPATLSTSNQQHIIALLVKCDDQQRARRRNDAKQVLKLYGVDKMGFLAFVFDLPKINIMGRAVNENDEPLEDENFHLLPGKTHDGWPDRKIVHYDTNQIISRAEYLALSEEDQQDYCFYRYFHLSLNGKASLRICDSDQYLMEELIRQSILVGDPMINRRYLTEIYTSADTFTTGRLYRYRNAIVSAFEELSENNLRDYAMSPMIITQAQHGYIQSIGQLHIALIQSLCVAAKPFDLLHFNPDDLYMLAKVIRACKQDDDCTLARFITDQDIQYYQNNSGDYLPGAIKTMETDSDSPVWNVEPYTEDTTTSQQKDFFKHILVESMLVPRLAGILAHVLDHYDPVEFNITPDRWTALKNLPYLLGIYDASPDAEEA